MIVLTDDSPADRTLMKHAIGKVCPEAEIEVAGDGLELLELLKTCEEAPHFILLDLNMPRMCGKGTLVELKKDEELRRIPVVIFTTSTAEKDRIECLALHANAVVTKPSSFSGLQEAAKALTEFWSAIATVQATS